MMRLDPKDPQRQRGLTAVELLVTIAILAILIGIAAPSMSRFIIQWRVSNAVNALTGSLRIARTEAIARARPVVVCRVASKTSTTCLSTAGTTGFASGWIVFANNDRDASSDYDATSDELLLRQDAPAGIANISLTNSGRFAFLPNGLLNSTATGINIDGMGFSSASATPWARKGLCISKPGRVRAVADATNCGSDTQG
ncbi:GspH/FimT family pseudopilin [Xenophilus arseniciresistens]|uniref:Type II secretion system protein H n=1 Tax=Xenophilus arseniciresistens TaxID=1283306 RepID=A0AAE3N3P1_9BURK|nr:GspH/FimT family pseudopilin [Xenophilus arseniciresistens]MDA7415200.1 GspH/FimT family pseudopilin [Xenophilus arseniciresistens]